MKIRWPLYVLFSLLAVAAKAGELDSLLKVIDRLEERGRESELLNIYTRTAYLYKTLDKFEEAKAYYSRSLDIARRYDQWISINENLFGIAMCDQRLNNFQEALQGYNTILELEKVAPQRHNQGQVLSNISSIYQSLGDYEKAFAIQLQALELHELAGDTVGIVTANYTLGTIFFYQDRFEQALGAYEKAYELSRRTAEKRLVFSCLGALGSVHERLGNDDKSIYYNQQSLHLAEELHYKQGISYTYGNMAANYVNKKDYPKAEKLYQQSIKLKTELGDKWGSIGSYLGLGGLYITWDQPRKAVPILLTALEMAQQLETKPRQVKAYQLLSKAYAATGDKKNAFEYLSNYVTLQDSVLNEKTVEEMGQSKRRYEIEKREHEIALLKTENELLGKNKKIQSLRNYFFVSIIMVLLAFSGWFFNRHKLQQQVNGLLEEKNVLLNAKNEEIFVKNKQLKQSNESLEQFAYVASHDLKEPLRMINSYTKLLERRYTPLFDESAKEFMFFITDAVSRMETLLNDLLDFPRAGNSKPKNDRVDFSDVLIIVQSNLKVQLAEMNATLIVRNENMPVLQANRSQLVQLVQNLVSNAVKFRGERDPQVIVDCTQQAGKFIFSVTDNGIGIRSEHLQKVFEMFHRLHDKAKYQGTGIGLAVCQRIVEHYGGELWVESVFGEGSTFFFSVPVECAVPELMEVS